jgi:hypothetical protein
MTKLPTPPDSEFREWCERRVAWQEEIRARHQPDETGRCVACVAVGLEYYRAPSRWPCGPYREAERIIDLLSGRSVRRAEV